MIEVKISYGELFDKISILEIKKNKLTNSEDLTKINYELRLLQKRLNKSKINSLLITTLSQNLQDVNLKLWNIEDEIREKERNKEFDDEFIKLARDVYITNDERAKIKNEINSKLNSKVFEVKSYTKY